MFVPQRYDWQKPLAELYSSPIVKFFFCLLFALTAAVFIPGHVQIASAGEKYEELVNCDPNRGPCSQSVSGRSIMLDITPKPVKAMQDLTFELTVSKALPADQPAPFIDLGMPGMEMGPNQVKLQAVGPDLYRGQGVIVRCPSGRKIWRARVTLPEIGKADFIFHVLY
jgi:hypothetical protein